VAAISKERKTMGRLGLVLGAVAALSASAAHGRPDNSLRAAEARIETGYIGGWTRAEPAAIAANFVKDGDFISPQGFRARGPDEIAAFYARAFGEGYKGSRASFIPRLSRRVAPGVVVIDGEWRITGARLPTGAPRPEERGIAIAVLVQKPAGWRIAALREQASAEKIFP
jgi:uncharacterized protein (TIGR02246 family)